MQAIRLQNEVTDAFASGESRITNEYLLVRELAHRFNNEYASLIGLTSKDRLALKQERGESGFVSKS